MPDEKITRLETLADEHNKRIGKLETGHAVNDERYKSSDKRIKGLEVNWQWVIKTAMAVIIGGIITAYLKGGV